MLLARDHKSHHDYAPFRETENLCCSVSHFNIHMYVQKVLMTRSHMILGLQGRSFGAPHILCLQTLPRLARERIDGVVI